MKMHYILVLCIYVSVLGSVLSQNAVDVQSSFGTIRGYDSTSGSGTLIKFLGIPFAKPPTGNLRFQRPVSPDPWNNVLDANSYSSSCYEFPASTTATYTVSEDCLYLNVFVPTSIDLANPKSVMFWIYGGSYLQGNANIYPGDTLALSQGVIVVTFNYRMGLFGFTSSPDGTLPGNVGLLDQNMALSWVYNNIAEFGGDNSSITIFGQSAGADSVFHHLMSSYSNTLFNRAIMQSRPGLAVVNTTVQFGLLAQALAPVCSSATTPSAINTCLSSLTAAVVLQYTGVAATSQYVYITIDGTLITQNSDTILSEGTFDTNKRVIIGFAGDDGDVFLKPTTDWTTFITSGISVTDLPTYITLSLNAYFTGATIPNTLIMSNLLYQKYATCTNNASLALARGALDMVTDAGMTARAFKMASQFLRFGVNTFMYEFDHLTGYLNTALNPQFTLSSGHGGEVIYTMVFLALQQAQGNAITSDELLLQNSISKAFADFAKTGQPNFLTNAAASITWDEYTRATTKYVRFTTTMSQSSLQTLPADLVERVTVWNSAIQGIQSFTTCQAFTGTTELVPDSKGTFHNGMGLVNMLILTLMSLFLRR